MKPTVRCAVYTRKSTEEGLDQAFNSLDAQREACEAYVLSQKHEGWKVLPDKYDDGGFSGGNMGRPALVRLLDDIKAGKVHVVVVYKVDRLTRSLADFAKIVEQFDEHGVSFVSITQQFSTTSSMGRLTLNVLLSFAQFEREVAGERIRDKIAASKKKGMWMGGSLSLGYGVQDKKLFVIPEEAERVRYIYQRYLDLGCVRRFQAELMEQNIVSKSGVNFSRGALYQILKNPIYIGKTAHKGQLFEGQHDALMEEDLWQAVQDRLKNQGVMMEAGKILPSNVLLTGILYGSNGARLSPTHTKKDGRRYRYYIDGSAARSPAMTVFVQRVPADDLEQLVVDRLYKHVQAAGDDLDYDSSKRVLSGLNSDNGTERRRVFLELVEKVVVLDKSIEIHLKVRIEDRAEEKLTIPYQFVPIGRGKGLATDGGVKADLSVQRQTLLKGLIRGFCLRQRLYASPDMTMAKLAKQEGANGSHLMGLVSLTYLAPNIVTAIIEGRTPPEMTLQGLIKGFPIAWERRSKDTTKLLVD